MGFVKKVAKFEIFNGTNIVKDIVSNPVQALVGAGDPFSTKVWNGVLGTDWDPYVNQMGGATDEMYQKAAAAGIDIKPGMTMHKIASAIASFYAGGAAAGAVGGGAGAAAGGAGDVALGTGALGSGGLGAATGGGLGEVLAGAGADALIPSVVVSGAAGGAGGLTAAQLAGLASFGIGVDAAGNYIDSSGNQIKEDTTPDELSDESVLDNATKTGDQIADDAIKGVNTPSLPDGLADLLKNITNIGSALNDKSNNQNTANNANGQLAAILAAANSQQGKNDAYIKQLNDAATAAGTSNSAYLTQLQDLYSTLGTNNSDYIKQITGQITSAQTAASEYAELIRQQAEESEAADRAYLNQLSNMYMPGTAEANAMQQEMNAKDAAAGRNSQYGVRAVNLAGWLAQQRQGIMTSSAYQNASNHSTANGLYGSQGYLDAIYNTAANQLLMNPNYLNALNGTSQTNLLESTAYQNAVNNTAANNILTSPAMAGTVNNSPLLNALTSQTNVGLNNTATNATNNQNNSLWATAGNAISNANNLYNSGKNIWNGLTNLFA